MIREFAEQVRCHPLAQLATGQAAVGQIAQFRERGFPGHVPATDSTGIAHGAAGRGTFIISKNADTQPTFAGVGAGDLIEARRLVEIPSAGFAAERRTPEQVRQLFEILDKLAAAPDAHEWVRYDGELHMAIAAASGNTMLTAMVADTRRALDLQSEFLNLTQDRRTDSDREHAAIVRAIEAGAPEAARAAMTDHLERVAETVARIGA